MTRSANFVEETTTSIAGTGGNGAVTLTAIASTPRFSTVFGTQATTIRYVIENTTTKAWEVGIGSVAANVLTRTSPQVTWDGTTYDDSTPAPIAFGSTPASGNIKVRLSATAEAAAPARPSVITAAIGDRDASWGNYPVSAHINHWTAAGQTIPVVTGREDYNYYRLDSAGLLLGFQLEVTALTAASSLRVALYSLGASGLPDQKILDFNNVDSSTTGLKTDTATGTWSTGGPVWLTPGWYAIAYQCSVGSVGLRGYNNNPALVTQSTPLGRTGPSYAGWASRIAQAGSFASGLPSVPSFPSALVGAAQLPWLGLRITA